MALPQDHIYYQGDTLEFEFQLWVDKGNNIYWDLTDDKIRFELIDGTTVIKKASIEVTGGGTDQINKINPTHGIFIVIITTIESAALAPDDYTFQIQVEQPDGSKHTVTQDTFRLLPALINWEAK